MSFNLSGLRAALPSASSSRALSTSSAARTSYPFSQSATVIPSSPTPAPKTTSLLRTLNLHLNSQTPNGELHSTLLSRRHPDRLLPGSVVTVSTYSTPPTPANPAPSTSSFSGVLIALRRRHAGRDTSLRLRNLVGRTGVEVSYKVSSPMIKEIKVVSRATTSGAPVVDKQGRESRRKPNLRAEKRAKLYFVRDQPDRKQPRRCACPSVHFPFADPARTPRCRSCRSRRNCQAGPRARAGARGPGSAPPPLDFAAAMTVCMFFRPQRVVGVGRSSENVGRRGVQVRRGRGGASNQSGARRRRSQGRFPSGSHQRRCEVVSDAISFARCMRLQHG